MTDFKMEVPDFADWLVNHQGVMSIDVLIPEGHPQRRLQIICFAQNMAHMMEQNTTTITLSANRFHTYTPTPEFRNFWHDHRTLPVKDRWEAWKNRGQP